MNTVLRSQTIAMTAICQAAIMIKQVARGESVDNEALKQLFGAVINRSPKSMDELYPSPSNLQQGSNLLLMHLSGKATNNDVEITRYLVGITAMAKALLNDTAALTRMSDKLNDVERRLSHFEIDSSSIIENFADCYSEVVSPLGRKIQIIGSQQVLAQPANQSKVRALLLAGIRAAVAWRQMGGKRRHLILKRRQLLQDAMQFNQELTLI